MKIEINAVLRDAKGTGASRRLRHEGKVPGVLYGGNGDAKSIELNAKDLYMQFKHEAFHASILTLNLDGKKESVLLRDYQMHPVRNNIQHIDLQRIDENKKLSVKIPFHFLNEDVAPGVKLEGGVVSHIMVDVDISCLPKDLPTYIEVDLVNLSIGDSIHLSEIKAPEGVELTALSEENDPIITSVSKPKVVVEETPVAAEGEEGEEGAEAAEGGDDKAAEGGDDKAAEGGDEKSDKKGLVGFYSALNYKCAILSLMNKIKLFAGLGNPGEKYQNTRHNCGFWWIDFVTNNHRLNLKHNAKFNGDIAKYTEDGNCFFLKPTTFMNESGKSLAAVANFYKIQPEEILVIHDELDIEPGKIKLKLGGGDGGHNGLKSITDSIKSKNFWRIRIGIGHPGNKNLVSNFVLKPPLKKENELIEDSILNSYKIFSLLKSGQFEKAMLNLHSV